MLFRLRQLRHDPRIFAGREFLQKRMGGIRVTGGDDLFELFPGIRLFDCQVVCWFIRLIHLIVSIPFNGIQMRRDLFPADKQLFSSGVRCHPGVKNEALSRDSARSLHYLSRSDKSCRTGFWR